LKRLIPALGLFFTLLAPVFSQQNFSRGEALFLENKPREALVFLEAAVAEDPANLQAVLYLGISYEQLEMLDDAIAVYRQFLPPEAAEGQGAEGQGANGQGTAGQGTAEPPDPRTARIAFNLGNAYYRQGDDESAEKQYTQAVRIDPGLGSAYLNRANTRVRRGLLREALPDYEAFLSLVPGSPKRPQVEQLLAYIRAEFAAEERRRLLEEARLAEEAERRRLLLEEVSASLQAAAEETQGLSAGTEDVLNYEGEFELE
jgi:tetratricopeptide (TPR) repeat protein